MGLISELISWPPQSVIYATDFSQSAERAGKYAQMLARQFAAALVVAHAFTLSQSAMEVEAEAGPGAKSVQRKNLESALKLAVQQFGDGVRRISSVLIEGDPQERIPELARANDPALIVLGTRGRGRLGRSLIGSAADGILRSADGPSLTVGPDVPELVPGTSAIRSVLFATDLSPAAARGAAYATGIAQAFGARLDALHAVHGADMKDPDRMSRIRKEFHAALQGVVPEHAEALSDPVEWIEAGNAHTRILEHVHAHKTDLLVLSVQSSAHLWLRERISGAFHIIAHSPCPVMTITE